MTHPNPPGAAAVPDYRAVFESSAVGIVLLDRKGTVAAANAVVLSLLGCAHVEPGSLHPEDLVHPDDRDLVVRLIRRLGESSGGREEHELRVMGSDGEYVWMSVHAAAEEGQGDAIVVILEDVTERRQMEEQRRLSQRIEAVGRLAGGIAHDFNNLITVINGRADLLLSSIEEDDPLRDDLEEIRRAGDRAAAITRQLLAFSRRQLLQPKIVNLSEVVAGMEATLRALAGDAIRLTLDLASHLAPVRADPAQIEQVILNLALNARDAMPNGGSLRISTHQRRFDAEFVRQHPGSRLGLHVGLGVSDTGLGMTDDVKARIFEPFFSTKEQGKGTGLGLSMSFGIVKQSDGYVMVESEPEKGSTLSIYLPAADEPARQSARETSAPASGPETILLVEDESMVRALAERILERQGYAVLSAASARQALRLAIGHKGPIHLLLTDVMMPRVGGVALAERMSELRPDTRVLFMSGYADAPGGAQGVKGEFLQKPFTPESLARKVRDVLDYT